MKAGIILSPPKIIRAGMHLLFWLIVLLLYTFLYGRLNNEYIATFIHLLLTLPVYITATYFTLYFIIPRYLLNKKYKQFVIASVYTVLGAAFFELIITIYSVVIPLDGIGIKAGSFGYGLKSLDVYLRLMGIFIVVFFASSIKLLKYWYLLQQKSSALVKEKIEAELNFLKSQVHPHFLFNTLNNLYALTLKKSEKSPEVVLKLSDILSYMLYDCNEDFIPLKKEIDLINNFITLEKLRYSQKHNIVIDIQNNIEGKKIAPMILFPFVENSFKHGIGDNTEKSYIKIIIKVIINELKFTVENSKARNKKRKSKEQGIGLENIRRRLNMIYRNNYSLDIKESDDSFSINLEVKLTNNNEILENEN